MEEGCEILEDGEILEEDNTASTAEKFSLSHVTREPKTICSEESSNDNSDNSDDDSDTQCSKPKIAKPQPQLPMSRNQVPNRFKVWSIALQEEALMENLNKCDVEAIDRERSVESYNYKQVDKTDYSQYSGYHMPVSECHFLDSDYVTCSDEKQFIVGSKRRHSDIKKRLGHKKDNFRLRQLPHLAVTAEDSVEDVAEDIALKLRESKVDLILNVVLVLGKQKAIELYNETKDVEDNGGIMLMSGERRRTSGGVYLLLLKRDDSITSDELKEIFTEDTAQFKRKRKKASKKRSKKKNQEIKETLIREKLLNLNTAAFIQDSETVQSEVPLGAASSNLEDGEVELTVTNPPPSPATDQDTPPSRTLGAFSEDEVEHDKPDDLCRKVVTYEDDDDDDYLEVDVDEMDVF